MVSVVGKTSQKTGFLVLFLLLLVFLKEGQTKKTKEKKGQRKKAASVPSNFFVGKLDSIPYNLEYPQLNGVMTPKNAKKLCEEDFSCAGFTYKGAKDLGQKFKIQFFHYLSKKSVEVAKKSGDWTWSSYRVSRPFVYLNVNAEKIKWDELAEDPSEEHILLFNPVLKQKYGVPKSKVNLREMLDLESTKSTWTLKVNLNDDLKVQPSTVCIKGSPPLPLQNYQNVAHVPCGKNGPEDEPYITQETENCLGFCSSTVQEKSELFSLIRNISTWSNSKNQVVKREKVRSEVLFKGGHLRASVHDRSAKMVKKIILNGEELENLEDLATKLSLRRSPQLLVDYWASEGDDEKSGKHFWVNPAGASTTYYYIEGDEPMEWILVPTNARSELATMTCNEGETLSPALTIHGLHKIQRGILQPKEMIYVPPGWSYQVKVKKGEKTITIGEAKLRPQAIEEAAASMGEQEIHALKKALHDPFWPLWRRFTEILRQRRRNK